MDEQLCPTLQSEARRPLIQSAEHYRTNFILNKQKDDLEEKLAHYRKLKRRWSHANTALKASGFVILVILTAASISTGVVFGFIVASSILGGASFGTTVETFVALLRFTSKR